MKRGFQEIKSIVTALTYRVQKGGDATFIKMQNREINDELKLARIENGKLKQELEHIREEYKEIKDKLQMKEDNEMNRVLEGRDQARQIRRNIKNKKEYPYMLSKTRSKREQEEEEKETLLFNKIEEIKGYTTRRENITEKETDKGYADRTSNAKLDFIMNRLELLTGEITDLKKQGGKNINRTFADVVSNNKDSPRIIENRKLTSPLLIQRKNKEMSNIDNDRNDDGWERQIKRGNKNKTMNNETIINKEDRIKQMIPRHRQSKNKNKKITIPKTSVVFIKEKEDGPPMAELLGIARTKINLKELNIIQQPKIRRAAGGGTLIEISDEEAKEKANKLCDKLREILADNAKILVPTKNITLRIAI